MQTILKDTTFQKTLLEIAEAQQMDFTEVEEKAAEYLGELYTIHQPVANIFATQMAQFILARGYEKTIDVNPAQLQALTKLARRHSIAFVMTHKTYIDMFVLGIVLQRHGLPIPNIFAGINMDFLGLGQFGRQNGVIFIRRSIKENLIYKATLRHFIGHLVKEKNSFMWAIEGTRSRTGKLVWPKMGILKYIKEAEAYAKSEVKYVPVSIVYDLIPDVKEMTLEARGKSKAPESLSWFLNYVRKMNEKFGRISIRIGEPVSDTSQMTSLIHQNQVLKNGAPKGISHFALELVHQINQITPVTTASLICVILMSKYTLRKKEIESYVAVIMNLIESTQPDALVDRGRPIGESVQTALNLLKKANLIRQHSAGLESKYVIASHNYLQATYYGNMAVHHLYHQAFIELALLKVAHSDNKNGGDYTFWQEIMQLRNLFKFEFFFSKKEQFTEEIERNMSFLDRDWETLILAKAEKVKALVESQRMLVAPVVLSTYVEAYRVVAHSLKAWEPSRVFNESQFLEDCVFIGESMQWQGMIQRLESISKPFLQNGIRLIKNLNLVPNNDDKKHEQIDKFIQQLDEIWERITQLQKITLTKPPESLPAVPLSRNEVPGSKTEAITHEIINGESGAHIGAFFDLDKTLIKSFSAKEFMQSRVLSGKMTRKEIVAQFAGVMVYATGNGNFAGLAAVGARGVKDIEEKVFIEVGEEVFEKELARQIYPEARALVAAHVAKGHTVAIISAATPYQVNPIARDFGIDHIMCTRMEVINGVFTGEIIEPACWGEGKSHAAKALVKDHNLDLAKSFFYTDSAEDLPLLEIVGNPRPMNPDTKLTAIAFQNDWPIYRFDDENERRGVTDFMRTGLAFGSLLPAVMKAATDGLATMSWDDGINSLMATVGDLVCGAAGIRLVVKGEENLWKKRPAVFILNHQSNVDMFIAAKLIRKDATGIAKKELQFYPIIGQLMQAAGVIFIDRKNREKAIEAMQPAVDSLKNGTSFIIFPEGTRSYDYRLGKFKKGAFHIAMQAGVPIIPIVIRNAHDSMPRGTNIFKPAAIEVKVLPAISTKRWTKNTFDKNIKKIRGLFLKELRQEE